jgi:hypothetical protein
VTEVEDYAGGSEDSFITDEDMRDYKEEEK